MTDFAKDHHNITGPHPTIDEAIRLLHGIGLEPTVRPASIANAVRLRASVYDTPKLDLAVRTLQASGFAFTSERGPFTNGQHYIHFLAGLGA